MHATPESDPAGKTVREILRIALRAALYGAEIPPHVEQAIASGDRHLPIDGLGLDSLSLMEFCIAVELETRQELTPGDVAEMRDIGEVEDWLRMRIGAG